LPWTQQGNPSTINFNFCNPVSQEYQCDSVEAVANFKEDEAGRCNNLSKKDGKGLNVHLNKTDNEDKEYITLEYTTDITCATGASQFYGINFEVVCDSKVKDPVYAVNSELSSECRPHVTITHESGCKVGDLNALWRFIEEHVWIFGIIFMVIGGFSLVLGRKLIKPTLFIFGCLATMATIMFLFYVLILPNSDKDWVGWLILCVSFILGCIVGFFVSKLVRIGVFILGVCGGAGIALILNNTVFYKINTVAVLWIMIVVFGVVLGVLSFLWFDYIVIITTSILGSYMLIRGLSFLAGGYPNEFTVYEQIKAGDIDAVPGTFYAYLAGMIILFIAGLYIQIKIKKSGGDKKENFEFYKKV